MDKIQKTKNFIRIKMPDTEEIRTVAKKDYITAKTKQLKEFGYGTLTEDAVSEQIEKLLKGDKKGLTVIGMFMEDEVIKEDA